MKKHEGMKDMKRFWPSTENICFVVEILRKTNFIWDTFRYFASFCFITFMFLRIV